MAKYIIECLIKNIYGVITQVGIGGQHHDVEDIANSIWNNQHEFYTKTPDGLDTLQVFARRREDTARPYLTTNPDGRLPNNLDSLYECKY